MLRRCSFIAIVLLVFTFPTFGQYCPYVAAVSPLSSAQVSSPVSFLWVADSYAEGYHLIIQNRSTGAVVFDESSIGSTTHSVSLPAGDYRWRVHAVGGPCHEIDITPINFTVASCPGSPPTPLTPANGATNVPSPVTFSWTTVANGTTYEVWLGTNGEGFNLLGTTSGDTLTASVPDGEHTWYVWVKTPGCPDRQSQLSRFSSSSAPPPTIANFDASPRQIRRGGEARLIWSTRNATGVAIDPGLGTERAEGSVIVQPQSTTNYTLTATGPGGTATAQVTVEVLATPEVAVSALPQQIVQGTSSGGGTTSYVLTNVGGESTSISLSQEGDFFTQAPESFELAPGASQRVMITGEQRDTGSFRGVSVPSGAGVAAGTSVRVQLLSVPTPSGPTAAEPDVDRIDVAARRGSNPTGTALFHNTGEATIQGTLVSTVPWLIPQSGLIEVDPGESVTVTFTIDRSLRPPNMELGSLEGKLMLVFRTGPSGKRTVAPRNGAASTTSLVTVVDTSSPEVVAGQIPPLAEGEVALFIPGAGHVQGGSGLFFSDIALVNLSGSRTLDDIRMFYTPITEGAGTLTTTVSALASATPIPVADVVRTVFDSEATLGSLQIRAPDIDRLGVNANIFLRRSGDQKIYGNTIPALRSDRSAGAGESVFLTGLTRTGNSRTNLFLQETSGGTVTAGIEFYDESGQKLGERTGINVGPFRLVGLFYSVQDPILPLGAVSAVITSSAESSGRFAAYATPVDGESGDSWSLVDWNAQYGFAGSDEMIIPVAGALQGANDLYFRTDVAAINRGDGQASGILRYITRPAENRPPIDRTITLGPRQSAVLEDVTSSLFELDPSQFTLGFLQFLPQTETMTVTSRNFATLGDDPGTFGTGVATLPRAASMRLGEVRRIGGVRDAALDTITAGTTGTFRSNFGMMETSGNAPVTIRVTVHFTFSSGTLAVARGSGSKEYTLQPNEFVQLGRVSREILGESRDDFGDFDNLQVEFAVVGGEGAAMVFVSSVENESGDSILRVD